MRRKTDGGRADLLPSVSHHCLRSGARATGVRLREVADAAREDLLEASLLGRTRLPGPVDAGIDGGRDRLALALEDAASERPACDPSRRRGEGEALRTRTGRRIREHAVPDGGP